MMVSIWFALNAIVGSKDVTTMYTKFKCNGCDRNTEFLWLEQIDTPEGFKAYQCMDCGCVGVKNVVEALHKSDNNVVRCKQCGSWQFVNYNCYTCKLLEASYA